MANGKRDTHVVLSTDSLEVVYENGTRALSPTSLKFFQGEFVVLLGSSGAGKSTLLRCLNGLVSPSSGEVMATDIGNLSNTAHLRLHRRHTGMVFQQHHLIGRLSVLANVLIGRLGYHSALASLVPWSRIEKEGALAALDRVGLLDRALDRADQLSGGQQQRVGIARALVQRPKLLLADEPIASLDPATAEDLLTLLQGICRSDGLTLVVSLHQVEFARQFADRIVGLQGGAVVFDGTPAELVRHARSLTGLFLSGKREIHLPRGRRHPQGFLHLQGARGHNLKDLEVAIPLGVLSCVTGVSGSGKSTLIMDTLYLALRQKLFQAKIAAAPYDRIAGLEALDKVINIDQSPIGRTPRSNPATYTGLLTPVRELLARLPEARARGYQPGRFSFNLKGGRCEACEGEGVIKIAMHFLPDIYVTCEACGGKRYNPDTLDIVYRGKNIAEILAMNVEEALAFFAKVPQIKGKLQTLLEVGLSYLALGQSSVTLSGGEAQRIKLAKELSKRSTGRTLYIMDEPTTGLHPADIQHLLHVLNRLVESGNTVVIIEHNLDVIKTADHLIDLGPEGGDQGGAIVAQGTPEEVARVKESYTGQFLKKMLAGQV